MSIYHKHHIIPRHMGGTDDPSNLILLTIEEHAQAHLELFEKYGNKRDWIAHRMLLGQISTAEARLEVAKLPKSEKWKQKARERMTGSGNHMWGRFGEKNPFYGKKHTPETLEKLRGKKSPEHVAKMRLRPQDTQKLTCPHCNKYGDYKNMKRWHMNNCKHNPELVPKSAEINTE